MCKFQVKYWIHNFFGLVYFVVVFDDASTNMEWCKVFLKQVKQLRMVSVKRGTIRGLLQELKYVDIKVVNKWSVKLCVLTIRLKFHKSCPTIMESVLKIYRTLFFNWSFNLFSNVGFLAIQNIKFTYTFNFIWFFLIKLLKN